jgi:hypothetical protein
MLGAGMSPSDRQFSARRSVEDPQDTAPERPGIPRDDDGTVADGLPPRGAQYPAHRSEGNPPDTAPERPAIPRNYDGTVSERSATGRYGSTLKECT